jgi:hypothetical protein
VHGPLTLRLLDPLVVSSSSGGQPGGRQSADFDFAAEAPFDASDKAAGGAAATLDGGSALQPSPVVVCQICAARS